MLIVHLFVTCNNAHVNLCHFFSSSWCQGLAATSACDSSWTFLFTSFQTSSDRFKNWCYNNDLSINLKTTSVMALGTRRNLLNADRHQIFIKNEIIESHKLLRVIIDRTLNWNKQIDAVCLNISRKITLLEMLS